MAQRESTWHRKSNWGENLEGGNSSIAHQFFCSMQEES